VSYLRSQFQLDLWTEGTKYNSQANDLVIPPQSSHLELMAQGKTKERREKRKKKKNFKPSPLNLSDKGAAPFSTKPRIPSANTRIECQRNKSRTFTKHTKHFAAAVSGFFSVLLTLSSLFSDHYPYLYQFPSFLCTKIHCSPSQLLFLPLLIHSLPLSPPT
jgi:hypothetical protein